MKKTSVVLIAAFLISTSTGCGACRGLFGCNQTSVPVAPACAPAPCCAPSCGSFSSCDSCGSGGMTTANFGGGGSSCCGGDSGLSFAPSMSPAPMSFGNSAPIPMGP